MSARKKGKAGPVFGVRVEVHPGAASYLARLRMWIVVDGHEIPWCPSAKILTRAAKARTKRVGTGSFARRPALVEVDFLTPRGFSVDHPEVQAQLAHAISYLETLPVRRPTVFARDPSVLEALARDLGEL